MPLTKTTIVAAIRGAFVGDAASLGTHWIYDPKEMAAAVPSLDMPEFKDPPTPNYYSTEEFPGHYSSAGMMSPYGEQMLFVTEYLAENLERTSGQDMTTKMLAWLDGYGGRPDSAMKKMKENAEAGKKYPEIGADDNQAHSFIKAFLVTCLYAGKPDLLAKVEEVVRVHQQNETAVAFGVAAAVITETVLMGGSLSEAIDKCTQVIPTTDLQKKDEVVAALSRAKEAFEKKESVEELMLGISHEVMKGKEDSPYYDLYGRSCALPGSFIVPTYFFHKSNSLEGDVYVDSLRANILGAGDTCSRAAFIGGILAAAQGEVPESWLERFDKETLAKVDAAANKIANHAVATCPAVE